MFFQEIYTYIPSKNMSNLDNPRAYQKKQTRLIFLYVGISTNIALYLHIVTKKARINVWKVK